MFKYIVMFLCFLSCSEINAQYRPFVSTRMAKAIMTNVELPDEDEDGAICDGSGWVTHGDGHKTPCPGCSACVGQEEVKEMQVAERQMLVYHFGAEWCPPCKKLKSETWANPQVKDLMSRNNVKLHMFDADNPEHNKFFSYYNIKKYPTVIIVYSNSLEKQERRTTGFVPPQSMMAIIQAELDEE